MGIFRRFNFGRTNVQLRFEGWNITNTPQFNNPGSNRSSLQLNPDGSIRNLNGFTEVTGTPPEDVLYPALGTLTDPSCYILHPAQSNLTSDRNSPFVFVEERGNEWSAA